MIKNFWFVIILSTTLFSCSQENILNDEELSKWLNDRNGCEGKRLPISKTILDKEDKILGLKEDVILVQLGRPDKSDYFKRSRKIHYYFIEPGQQCSDTISLEGKKLAIEVNAVGLIKAVWKER